MNRRSFLSSLSIATAALYLRIMPHISKAAEVAHDVAEEVQTVADNFYVLSDRDCMYQGRMMSTAAAYNIVVRKK